MPHSFYDGFEEKPPILFVDMRISNRKLFAKSSEIIRICAQVTLPKTEYLPSDVALRRYVLIPMIACQTSDRLAKWVRLWLVVTHATSQNGLR